MAELLFELGTEELPARFVVPALEDLERTFREQAAALNLKHGAVRRLGTPRRLALRVSEVVERTDDQVKEVQGPSVKAGFKPDGTPATPAIKFAQSVNLPVEQLLRVTTAKGEYLAAKVEEKGRRAAELLPAVLDACVRKVSFAKSMRWGDVEQSFGRPLQWMVALLGAELLPVQFSDVRSGRQTRGHRFLANAWIPLPEAAHYESALERAHVLVDLERRRALLLERVAAAAARAGGAVLRDDALVEQVLNLIELPCPVVGSFEARHLELPPEVLVQEMKSHQRYFSLVDSKGALLPRFIAVSNTPVRDEALSVRGYERVLRARLTDGRFFFDGDRQTPLADRLPKLARRAWVAGLGSMAEKTDRIRALAGFLATAAGQGALLPTLERAASLCKADLETGMVGEFPELQGVMGREYALHGGEPAEVALAIFEHYLPRSAGDGLPTAHAGALLGLADRFDSLAGLFAIGKKPTGAQDQYGLRRAAIAIINLTLGKGYRYSLEAAIARALELLQPRLEQARPKAQEVPPAEAVREFFRGRLEALWREKHRADVVEAVLSEGFDDLVGAAQRVEALSAAAGQRELLALGAAFKRIANILEKQGKELVSGDPDTDRPDPAQLTDDAEKALFAAYLAVEPAVRQAKGRGDYAAVISALVGLKGAIDSFFEKVMVMAPEPALRTNRVRLLQALRVLFVSGFADLSRLQVEAA